jgi:tRNA threonylcarbamoyladenosine biosynthesis protein TsaB
MLLLATDTSGRQGSIALARGAENGECELVEVVPLSGGTFSAQLVPQIASLLANHGFTKNDIGGFVVASGPGSFTGLRVGLAAIKALAEILGKPIAAVSVLEAIALTGGSQGKVAAALDAGRDEVYVGEYEVSNGSTQCLGERLLGREEVATQIQATRLITPSQMLAEAFRRAGLTTSEVKPPDAGDIARVGWRKIQKGETVSAEQLEANYIRRLDAKGGF